MGDDIDGEAEGDYSGLSVSLSGDGTRVAIGAYLNDDAGSNAGHARVFEWDGASWNKMGEDLDGRDRYDLFGYSVSLSEDGTRVVVGSIYSEGSGISRVLNGMDLRGIKSEKI